MNVQDTTQDAAARQGAAGRERAGPGATGPGATGPGGRSMGIRMPRFTNASAAAGIAARGGIGAHVWRWRRVVLPVVVLAGAIGTNMALVATKEEVVREARPERVWTVDAVAAERADHRPEVHRFGTVVAGRAVDLRAQVGGTVVEISPALRDGGIVRAGETLLRIDPLDYELIVAETKAGLEEAHARLDELKATVESERARVELARRQLDVREREMARSQELFKKGTIAAPRLEQAELALAQERQSYTGIANALQAGEARVRQQEATIARLSAQLVKAETDLLRTRLTAPFDGFIGQVNAEVGSRLGPADRVALISGAEGLEAKIALPTPAYGRLVADGGLVGRPAEVRWTVDEEVFTFPARVDRVIDRIDTAVGGVGLFVRLEGNFRNQPLRPGAFVEVSIPDRLYTNVVKLPPAAMHGDDTVYVVGAEDRLEKRQIEVAATSTTAVFVEHGLDPGDKVVITRFQEIGQGVKVAVRGNREDDTSSLPQSAENPAASADVGTDAAEQPAEETAEGKDNP